MSEPTTVSELTVCLACGGSDLHPFLDLGAQPLANDFRPIPTEQTTIEWEDFPLALNVCRSCWHAQQKIAVDPVALYSTYNYVSGTSASLKRYFAEFVDRVELDFPRCTSDATTMRLRVLDIACNDGTLLKMFKARGHTVLGVDPALNLREMAAKNGVPVFPCFWDATGAEMARNDPRYPFDVIVAMNVLGHVADPLTFLKLCKQVLAPGGRIYVQTSQARMVENCEFDTVYAEHLSFFTASSFIELANRAGVRSASIDIVDVHGGSYLVTMRHWEDRERHDGTFVAREEAEDAAGLYDLPLYDAFQQRARDTLDLMRQILNTYRAGRRVVGYGAAAKSMTFVNALMAWMGRYPSVQVLPAGAVPQAPRRPRPPIDYFVDDAPLKQNTLCPGSGIPVYAPERLDGELGPVLFVITAWTMKTEIIERIKARRPGKRDLFLTYFPTIEMKG